MSFCTNGSTVCRPAKALSSATGVAGSGGLPVLTGAVSFDAAVGMTLVPDLVTYRVMPSVMASART